MFPIDLTKNQLTDAINQHQGTLDHQSTRFQRRGHKDLIASRAGQRRLSNQQKKIITKELADIQRNQIQLKSLDEANKLLKGRMEDEDNLIQWEEKFPYGKENVDISEDVLERYKGNFSEQARILEKFRKQAEQARKTSRVKRRPPVSKWQTQLRVSVDNKNAELEKMKRTFREERKKNEQLRALEEERMRKLAEMLGGLSNQLHNNSYILDKGIRDLKQRLKRQKKNTERPEHKRPAYKDILDLVHTSRKIPVVTYQDRPYDARLYFSDVYKQTERVKKLKESSSDSEEYKKIMKILRENNRRLEYLQKYSNHQSPLIR